MDKDSNTYPPLRRSRNPQFQFRHEISSFFINYNTVFPRIFNIAIIKETARVFQFSKAVTGDKEMTYFIDI